MHPLHALRHHADAEQRQPGGNHFAPQAAFGFQGCVDNAFGTPLFLFLLQLRRRREKVLSLLFVESNVGTQHRLLRWLQRLFEIDTRFYRLAHRNLSPSKNSITASRRICGNGLSTLIARGRNSSKWKP
ncbi:hypothetical protein D3C73_933330 [compost metagenome]